MQTITTETLRNKLMELKGCTIVSVMTRTKPVTLKDCPYDLVKVNVMSGFIGVDYGNRANNQLGREDKELNFVPQARKWGVLMDNKILVRHTKKGETEERYYLQLHVTNAHKPIFVDQNTLLEVGKEEVALWVKESSAPHTQAELDKKIIIRDIELANITRMKMMGDVFLTDDDVILGSIESVKEKIEKYETVEA